MPVDPAATLAAYVGAPDTDTDYVGECAAQAEALVAAYVATTEVPAAARKRAVLEVGSELFHRRSAPNGIAQFAAGDCNPIRVARDPMVGAYPILNRYVVSGL